MALLSAMAMSRDWSSMPSDCLRKISENSPTAFEYSSLRLVCRDWAVAIPRCPSQSRTFLPLLMLVEKSADRVDQHNPVQKRCRFVNVFDTNPYSWSMILPEAFPPNRVCGSSHGWLIILAEFNAFCLNLVSGERVTLPPIRIPFTEFGFASFSQVNMEAIHIKKVVLSCSPLDGTDYIAVAFTQRRDKMIYCRKGDTNWKSLLVGNAVIHDAVFWKGSFYVLQERKLVKCDLGGIEPSVTLIDAGISCRLNDLSFKFRHYLVGLENSLLLVSRRMSEWLTVFFEVYKLNNNVWVRQEFLDSAVLFLAQYSSVSVSVSASASDFPGCTGNTVYFSDDCWANFFGRAWLLRDFGKFSMDTGTVEHLLSTPDNTDPVTSYASMWFTPSP